MTNSDVWITRVLMQRRCGYTEYENQPWVITLYTSYEDGMRFHCIDIHTTDWDGVRYHDVRRSPKLTVDSLEWIEVCWHLNCWNCNSDRIMHFAGWELGTQECLECGNIW